MKKGQIAEGIVVRVDFPNKGIVRVEEKTESGETAVSYCTVKNVIPGQRISFFVKKVRKGKGEGILKEVLEKSENEVIPPCAHFGICGGCTYLNLSYEDQAALKEQQVKELLESVLKNQEEPYEFLPIRKSPAKTGYRNKMEFTFGDAYKDGPLSLGMHKRGSFYDIVTVDDCCICDEDYHKILKTVLAFFEDKGVTHYHRMNHTGYLRHLLVRKAAKTGEILVAIVTTTQQTLDLQPFCKELLELPLQGKIVGILHTKNDSVADVVQSDETNILYGKDYITEELLGLHFHISQFSFFQTNSLGAEVLYSTAREFIGDLGKSEKTVFDLYSGTGTIAQLMAPVAKKVIGVEIVEEAVEAARENAALNGLSNCEFIAGDVLKVLDTIEEKPDFIILDPPRDGVHPKALKKIIDYGVDRLIYISCKPTSLVRDLEQFLSSGYRVEKAVPVEQFPWTANVETVVLLSKRKADDYVEIE
ncbi:MAG: 23S rRNA (uracil(1939)-C(5))-methyltransferase RlmD [Lachnospiraceae bacterium]